MTRAGRDNDHGMPGQRRDAMMRQSRQRRTLATLAILILFLVLPAAAPGAPPSEPPLDVQALDIVLHPDRYDYGAQLQARNTIEQSRDPRYATALIQRLRAERAWDERPYYLLEAIAVPSDAPALVGLFDTLRARLEASGDDHDLGVALYVAGTLIRLGQERYAAFLLDPGRPATRRSRYMRAAALRNLKTQAGNDALLGHLLEPDNITPGRLAAAWELATRNDPRLCEALAAIQRDEPDHVILWHIQEDLGDVVRCRQETQ